MSEESIVSLFESSESQETEAVEVVEETVETAEEQQSEESQEETNEEATTATKEDVEEANERKEWTFHAVKDERSKRQKLEKELEELKASLETKEDTALPDVIEDQEGFVKSLESKYEERLARDRINIYREIMVEQHDDYLQKEEQFIELAKTNPMLLAQMQQSSNPAKFAYEQMVKYEQFQEMQDVESLREKIRAEERAKLEEQQKSTETEQDEKAENLSPSLAKARGSADKTEKLSENPSDLF